MVNIFNIEKEYLEYSKEVIKNVITSERIRLKESMIKYKDDPFLLQSIMSTISIKLNNLEKSEGKPYFARIDFQNKIENELQKCYIGKIGVISDESDIVVVDWRAPISTLYYDSNIGESEYIAPDGVVSGDLLLKRQILIENGELIDIFDVDSVSDDELLKPYLGVNADNRLKNIVASIQKEQNNIIRANIDKDIIVQGVAGSGKTTVALHRISYLIYNLKDKRNEYLNQEKFMVIGPNKFFINYISSVLPDLDVICAKQVTIEELALEYINENIKIIDKYKENLEMERGKSNEINKLKTSIIYKEMIDEFFNEWEKKFFGNGDLIVEENIFLKENQIRNIYNDNLKNTSINTKTNRTIQILSSKILEKEEILREKVKKIYDKRIKLTDDDIEKERLKNAKFKIYKELNNGFKNVLIKYFENRNIKVLQIYKQFLMQIDKYNNMLDLKEIDEMIKNIDKRTIEVEDIPALMYIKYRMVGEGDMKKYIHTVIDEAQDLGSFHFYVLRNILSKSTFTILGDLAQSIYAYRAINNWDEVIRDVYQNKCELLKLNKSYRTSIEIMEQANRITKFIGLENANPVIRHGEKVKTLKIDNKTEKIEYLIDRIKEFKEKEYKSIAIICKDIEIAKDIYKILKDKIIDISLITDNSQEYNGGICIITSYLTKGLEFDTTIILDVDEKIYNSDNLEDMKLLYVTMTRALHEMELIYTNEITKPLK